MSYTLYVPPYYAPRGEISLKEKFHSFFAIKNSMPIFHNPLTQLPFRSYFNILSSFLTIHFFCHNYWFQSFVTMYINITILFYSWWTQHLAFWFSFLVENELGKNKNYVLSDWIRLVFFLLYFPICHWNSRPSDSVHI